MAIILQYEIFFIKNSDLFVNQYFANGLTSQIQPNDIRASSDI